MSLPHKLQSNPQKSNVPAPIPTIKLAKKVTISGEGTRTLPAVETLPIEQTLLLRATASPLAKASEYAAPAIAILLLIPALLIASHWPFVHDAPIIRYINFLIANGFAPYRDIVDIELPGAYLADSLVVHTLGTSPFAWFAWDALNGIILTLALISIAGKDRRLYGLTAGILTCLAHLSDGPWFLGQRDWTVAMLTALSVGCLFQFVRTARPAWIGCAFLLSGLAATIKPPALLLPAVLLAAICLHRRTYNAPRRNPIPHLILWALAGIIPPTLVILLHLERGHALQAFLATLSGLIPYYASLHRPSLLALAAPARLAILLSLIAAALYIRNRSWRSFESNLLCLASTCGIVSYVVQGKGFPYHLYTAITFLFLWILLELSPRPQAFEAHPSRPAAAALLVFVPVIGLLCLSAESARTYPMNTLNHLESDLTHLGGAELSHHVQCLDMTLASCINVLYRMRLVQSTGTISDFYLFADHPTPLTTSLQNSFFQQIATTPPDVFVLSNQMWPSEREGYTALANFPQLQNFLNTQYTLTREYTQAHGDPAGYRLYIHK